MKAKTKRKLKHLITKKKILKRKGQQRLLQSLLVVVTLATAGSLGFAIATAPKVDVRYSIQTNARYNPSPESPEADTPVGLRALPGQRGRASWYALGLPQPDAFTCASTKYARGTYLHVTNLGNGREVTCLVNDYGPAAYTNRVIDLSRGSFLQLDSLGTGVLSVSVTVVPPPPGALNLLNPQTISGIVGYNLCLQGHNAAYCEAHRTQH